jgi:uncharacterized protein
LTKAPFGMTAKKINDSVESRQKVRVDVHVIPNAKWDIIKQDGTICKVYLVKPPERGKANEALIEMFADRFQVKKSRVSITKGLHSRRKTIIIEI